MRSSVLTHRFRFVNLSILATTIGLSLAFAWTTSVAHAQVTTTSWTGGGERSTDAFDVSQGTTVLSSSSQNAGSDARSALGYNNVGSVDPVNTYFLDSRPAGTVDFINFRTASLVTIVGFQLRTYDDSYVAGNNNRGMTRFTLFSSSDGGANYTPVAGTNLQNNYTNFYGTSGILISASFAPITAQDFRIEAVRFNTTAPRLAEFDAVTASDVAAPEPGALSLLSIGLIPLVGAIVRRRKA